jgi:LysR family transcriptional regulator, benzoate and cis,cis-muconate-responsive activator of ben and cat genes
MSVPELRLVRYFVAVAEELHFGRAAHRLRMAQPGLSQQIKSLEQQLGVRLLDRTSRQVTLTPAGSLLLGEGRRLLALAERTADQVRRAGLGQVGRISVAAIGSATYDVIPHLVREHRRRFPDVEVLLREMSTPAQVHALRDGEIDVGFLRLPADIDELVAHVVREERMALMLPESHPLAELREVPLRALARERLIVFPAAPRPSWADTVIAACREAGFEPDVAQEAMESATVVSFVAAGIGVAPVPEGLLLLARPGVVCRLVAPPAPVTRLAVVHRAGDLLPAVAALLDVIRELWPAQPAAAGLRRDRKPKIIRS